MPRAHPRPDADDLPAADPAGPSKTQLKKQMLALQALGEAVSTLPADRLAALPIEERLRDAIAELQRVRSHEGRRRQVQYIGKLMRLEDAEPLREAVAAYRLGGARETLALHEAESWRTRLLADDAALEAWLRAHPATDAQRLRSLLRAARREAAGETGRHGRAYRDIFQLVRQHLAADAPDTDTDTDTIVAPQADGSRP